MLLTFAVFYSVLIWGYGIDFALEFAYKITVERLSKLSLLGNDTFS